MRISLVALACLLGVAAFPLHQAAAAARAVIGQAITTTPLVEAIAFRPPPHVRRVCVLESSGRLVCHTVYR